MLRRLLHTLRPRSIYDVMAAIACFGVLAGGSAYAANTIGSTDIIDNEVKSADVKDESLTTFDVSTFLGADVVDGTLTGADVSDNSLGINDIGSQSVGADEVLNNSLLSSDLSTSSVGGDELTDNSVESVDVKDGSLNDEDVGKIALTNVAANIPLIQAHRCSGTLITQVAGAGPDHVLVTPSSADANSNLVYSAFFIPGADPHTLQLNVCNPTDFQINASVTHFNLLVIDAQ